MAERSDIIISSDSFPGNSNKSKEKEKEKEKPKLEKVVSGTVTKSKPSFLRKAFTSFFSDSYTEEDLKDIIIFDYLIPTTKDTIVEMGKMILEGIFYGSTGTRSKSTNSRPYQTSYSKYYDNGKKPKQQEDKITSKNFYEYTFCCQDESGRYDRKKAYEDADKVLSSLIEAAEQYRTASVADFCEFAGITAEFTDNDYGWNVEDLVKRTKIVRNGPGWRIVFPDPKPIPKD